MQIPERDAWTTLQEGRLVLAAQIRGACAVFDGNWSCVFGSVVVLGACFVSLVTRLVPSLSLLAVWKDIRAAQPGGSCKAENSEPAGRCPGILFFLKCRA